MKLGFKKGKSIFYLSYPSIEDYIGFDEETGKMIHLHLHYELMIGKKFIKGVRLPWEKKIYETVIKDEKYDVKIIDPNIEMLLLLLRNNLKINFMRKLKGSMLSKDETIEFKWLKEKIDTKKILELSKELLHEELGKIIVNYLIKNDKVSYKKMNRKMSIFYKKRNNYSNWRQTLKYSYLKLNAAIKYILNKKLKQPTLYRRGLPEGGIIISFVGVDGSGKSTMIKETKKWLSWKIDVYQVYFGSGDGECSLLRRPLKFVNDMRSKRRGNALNITEKKNNEIKKSSKMKIAKILWALTLALEKKNKIYKILKARNQGMIVLTDRYPQIQFKGYNDGPLLRGWKNSKSKLKRKISEWEYEIYKLSNEIHPDIVFKLLISEEVSATRKDDTPSYMIRKKIETIKSLEFKGSITYKVNTERSIDESSLEIKAKIWNYLNGN